MLKPNPHLAILLLLAAIIAGCAKRAPAPTVLSAPVTVQQGGYTDAVELKLKFRELADQLLATMPNDSLKGYVAMPTSFVNENNTSQTCPLGRLIAESMYYEFNQRGFPTREYRLSGNIAVRNSRDDLALVARRNVRTKGMKSAALLVGTYQPARDATFINARLVRASDGLVLRTAEMVLPNTPVVLSLLAGGTAPVYTGTTIPAPASSAYVAPQSAPVRAPTYPALGGASCGTAGYIPIIQGR